MHTCAPTHSSCCANSLSSYSQFQMPSLDSQAEDVRFRRQQEKHADTERGLNHIKNQRDHAFLREDPNSGIISGTRVRRDQWKGMSAQQLNGVNEQIYMQQLENKARRERERQESMAFSKQQDFIVDAMQQVTVKEQMEAQAMEYHYRNMQAQQIVAKHQRDQTSREMRNQKASEEFFNYFGKSCR